MAKVVSEREAAAMLRGAGFKVKADIWPDEVDLSPRHFRVDQGCWLWKNTPKSGYGPYMSFWRAYHDAELDQDRELHHTCFRGHEGCVNPEHLEVVTAERHAQLHRNAPRGTAHDWGQAIRKERMARFWTQRRMAEELGVHPLTLNGWERGRWAPSRVLQRIIIQKLGWELLPRKFVVQVVVQDVVVAQTAAEAVQSAMARIPEPLRGSRKRELLDVRALS